LREVKEEMGVHGDNVKHNSMNTKLIAGCTKNNFAWKVAPQNIKDTSRDSAGWTCFGPKQGNKQGGGITWLRDYCRTGNGTLFNGHAVKVTSNSVTLSPASSLHDKSTHFTISVRSKIIVACGSLHTPLLLQRSGCKNNNIGSNLRLHPVSAIMASCEEEMHGYKGAPMTTVCTEFEKGLEGDNYGPKLECPSVHTGVMAAALPWNGAQSFKSILQCASKMVAVIVLQRDKGSGKVTGTGEGGYEPNISYSVDKRDKENILNGLEKAFDILSVNPGVKQIWACHPKQVPYEVDKADGRVDSSKAAAFKASLRSNGCGVNDLGLFCAHQMGSCRMARNSSLGAVDVDGEVWEMDNVHVIDASLFPTASGANPMMTTMALSRGLAKRLVEVHNGTKKGEEIKRRRKERRGKEGKGFKSDLTIYIAAAVVGFAATLLHKRGMLL
jgi:choline dehydrogenase-like flavoprotein